MFTISDLSSSTDYVGRYSLAAKNTISVASAINASQVFYDGIRWMLNLAEGLDICQWKVFL